MGNIADVNRDHNRVTIGKPSSEYISIPRDINHSSIGMFVEEIDGEGGGTVVYCSCGHLLFNLRGTRTSDNLIIPYNYFLQ